MFSSMGALGLNPAALATETPPFTPLDTNALRGHGKRSVVVMGGGIAGMTTAYELLKGGYDVTVLEGRDRPGGRNWTVRGGDTYTDLDGNRQRAAFSKGEYMNTGPGRIPQMHVTLDYCKELGVDLEVFNNQNADAFLYREGDHGLDGEAVRHRAAKADVYGYTSELLAKATDQGALDAYVTEEDKEQLIAFLRGFGDLGDKVDGDPAASFAYTGTSRRGYEVQPGAGLESGVETTPYALSDVLASGIGRYFSFEFGFDQAMVMLQPVGGMDRIAYAFADAIGRRHFRYGTEVVAYRNTADGVEVSYRQGGATRTITADFAVNTIPPHLAAEIPSNLPSEVIAALRSAQVSNAGKLGIEYDRRWWEEDYRIYGGISNANTDLSNIWHPSYGYHGDKGVMIGYYNTGGDADSYGALTPDRRLRRAVAQGRKIFGDVYTRGITASFSQNWARAPFSEGSWVHWRDQNGADYERLLEPAGNIHFADDHLSHAIAWQHGAMVSARAAVTRIQERVAAA